MSTRGFLGFVIDFQEKIAYNHHDSCPSRLGIDTLTWLRGAASDVAGLADRARELRVVSEDTGPSAADIERLRGFANLNVSEQRLTDWYVLLRETQGSPEAMLNAGVVLDGSEFPQDSLWAEYGYIVDLDRGVFEAYEGFQQSEHIKGRFSRRPGRGDYFPVALVAEWKLTDLPSDEDFLAALEPTEDVVSA